MQSSADKELCGLVVRQLQAYGLTSVAAVVADAVGIVPQLNPSDELAQLVAAGRRGSQHSQQQQQQQPQQQQPGGLDLDTEGGSGGAATRPFGKYECPFFTTHKKPTRAVAISPDGRLVATGSDDTTIKVLDATKVGTGSGARNYRDSSGDAEGADKPLLRTLYDHAGPINELAFHPTGLMLTSCAKDGAIKFFDMSREKKYSARQIQQAGTVRSISYHPSGDYLLAATDHHTAHLYEMANFNCYDPVDPDFEHRGPINSVRFSPQGHQYATASKDGSWKMWDAVAGKCIFTVSNAHVEAEIASVAFNPSTGKYVLTFGKDSTVRMWDSSNGALVQVFERARMNHVKSNAAFCNDEDYVIAGDEVSNNLLVWDVRKNSVVSWLQGHSAPVRAIATSSASALIVSGAEDHRARFWLPEAAEP